MAASLLARRRGSKLTELGTSFQKYNPRPPTPKAARQKDKVPEAARAVSMDFPGLCSS